MKSALSPLGKGRRTLCALNSIPWAPKEAKKGLRFQTSITSNEHHQWQKLGVFLNGHPFLILHNIIYNK